MGEYDPETKKFKPEPTAGLLGKGSRKYEQEFFTSQKGKKLISQNSAKVVEKDLIAEGKSPDDAMIEAAELTKESSRLVKSELSNELAKGGKDKHGTRREFGSFVYPETLRESEQDVIKFTILKYQPKGFKARESSLDFFGERNIMKGRTPVGTVVLPIPGGIGDSNSCDWGEDSMTAMQAAIANIGLSFLTGTDLAGQITGTAQGVQNNKDDIKEALSNSIVEAATGGQGGALLSRTKGVIMNPNMELLFKKPQLRPFTFTFKLAPRSRTEAIQVINIIRTFKQSMAPIRSESNLFLRSPHTYRLQYMSRGKVHPYLNMFKECALTNLNMKYTPDGNYSTYEDGVMTAYEMTMQFKELEPVFNDDYEMSASSTIGQDTDLDWDSSNPGTGKLSTKIGY